MVQLSSSKNKGKLEVICGSMFSGKSEELIRRLRRATIAKQHVITFKHSLDNRHTTKQVTSHDGNNINACACDTVEKLLSLAQKNEVDVVGIDEIQFFSPKIVSVIEHLIEQGKRVIAAGLDLDFRGVPFGCMPTLLSIADSITKLQAICSECGNDAHFTQRLVNGKPAHYNAPVILVGAQESYQARCRNCHVIDTIVITKAAYNEQTKNNISL